MASPSSTGVTPETPENNGNSRSLTELRELIVGPEQRELARLRKRLDDPNVRAEDISQIVAEAIALRSKRDRAVLRTLQPMIEESLKISVERDPRFIADALYPIIGQAVRKAVAHSLRGMVESLNHILERSFSWDSAMWRIEALRTGKSFGEIALMRSLRFRVEEVFLIHRETGLLLAHAAAKGAITQDADLVSGMLTAVQDFVRDSFTPGKSDELETMQVGEYTVWVLHGPLALIAGVVSGAAPPDLRNIFQRTLEHVHGEFSQQLQGFSGDAATLSGVKPLLQACLLGSQSKEIKRSYRWVWPVTALALIIFAATFFYVRQQMRWSRYVERLHQEPGIILASEEHHWNSFDVVGLRDPLAVDPELLLLRYRLDPDKVTSRWEPYSSLDPVYATARKMLNGKDSIEQQVIRFGVNSSKLDPSEVAKIDVLAAQIAFLRRQATMMNAPAITIAITGHTDRSGQETANALLSQRRAEEVRQALVDRGVPVEMFSVQGVGASKPAGSQSESYLDELNRRVTVHVELPPIRVRQ
jgi:outer membrane protein OmpA-like peptidoglycan-associated protein